MYLRFLNDNYYLLCLGLILVVLLMFSVYYSRRLMAKEIVVIAVLSSIIAISRGVFFWAHHIKPVTALVLVSASIFGSIPGALIGLLSAFLSNLFLGQGPWSPFQMIAWGLVGFVGGKVNTDNKWIASLTGFVVALALYGPIVNFASMLMMTNDMSWEKFWLMELSGIPVDMVHAISTVIFVYFVWKPMRKKLVRLRNKYGILRK